MTSRPHSCPVCGKLRAYVRSADTLCADCYKGSRRVKHIRHGTDRGYRQHLALGVAYSNACGCLAAHNEAVRQQRWIRGESKRTCTGCGEYRACRGDRDGMCAPCWKRHLLRDGTALESEFILQYGRWVTRGGIQVWEREDSA